MEQKIPPKSLFRYYSRPDFARSAIENSKIYMSSATQFNDPFDLNIAPKTEIEEERLIAFAKSEFAEKKQFYMDQMGIKDETEIKRRFAEYFEKKEYNTTEGRKSIESGAIFAIVSHGICCFTEKGNNMHFWANYANNHIGICIEFRPDYRNFPFNKLGQVEYQDDYPVVGIDEKEKYKSFFQIKHSDWNCEKEWRLIIPYTAEKFIEFGFYELTSVICGCNMRPNDIEKTRIWLFSNTNAAKYRPKLFCTEKSQKEFGLKLIEIPT